MCGRSIVGTVIRFWTSSWTALGLTSRGKRASRSTFAGSRSGSTAEFSTTAFGTMIGSLPRRRIV